MMDPPIILGQKAEESEGVWIVRRFPFFVKIGPSGSVRVSRALRSSIQFKYDYIIWFWWDKISQPHRKGRAETLEQAIQLIDEECTSIIQDLNWFHVSGIMRS